MTRIRKNWSSSRGAEESESPPPHVLAAQDSHIPDTEGKPSSPVVLQLVDEDAMHMLAAVSLESLEHDSGIPNLKREDASAKVKAAISTKSLEHDVGMHNLKHDKTSAKIWDRPFLPGNGLISQRSKSDQWYQKLSALWRPDRGPVSSSNASTRKEMVDEEQSKSSSVADSEMVDCDLSARVERAKQGMAVVEPAQGLISEFRHVHCLEREPSNDESSRVLQELVFGRANGRKKRQKPWESESDRPVTVAGYRADQMTLKSEDSEGYGTGDTNKRRVKSSRVPQDQGTGDQNTIRAESAKVVTDVSDEKMPGTKSEKLGTDVGDGNQPKAKSEKVGNDADDKDQLKAKVEQVVDDIDDTKKQRTKPVEVGVDIENRKKQRAKSQEVGTDGGDRKRPRTKPQKLESGLQKGATEDIFPKGWKYKGLAQIAEKDEPSDGQVKKLCGRTDGHNWRCPLRVVEGLSLCQHHLNKARAKKMGKSNQQRKQSVKKEPNEALASPDASDSSIPKSGPLSDQHVPTKYRRRHKTVKLSVL